MTAKKEGLIWQGVYLFDPNAFFEDYQVGDSIVAFGKHYEIRAISGRLGLTSPPKPLRGVELSVTQIINSNDKHK